MENKISSYPFCELLKKKLELSKELSNNTLECEDIHEKARKFTGFLGDLLIICKVCDRNPEPYRLPDPISETEF